MSALLAAALLLQVQDLRPAAKACPFVRRDHGGRARGHPRPPESRRQAGEVPALRERHAHGVRGEGRGLARDRAGERVGPAPAPTSGLAPAPTRASLSGFAKQTSLRDADAAVRQNQTLSGKMKIGEREISLDDPAPFFGKESVAQHLQLSTFRADAAGCPGQRARAYGSVKNISRMKLRGLKALVLIGSVKSGDYNGQVQSMDPSDLVPGEESEIFLWLSCDWAGSSPRSGRGTTPSSSSSRTSRDGPRKSRGRTARTRSRPRRRRRSPPRSARPRRRAVRRRAPEAALMPDAAASLALMWVDPATGETMKVPLDHALRLGSNRQQNDVALPFAGVEPLHAEIVSRAGGGWEIAPVGVVRLKVDGAMVPRAELRPGSTFSIGILDFTVGYAGPPPEQTDSPARMRASISGSRVVTPPPPRRPAVAGPRPPEPDRRLTFALLGGGLVAVAAAGLWFAVLRPRSSGPPGAVPAAALGAGTPSGAPSASATSAAPNPVPTAAGAPNDPFLAAKKSVVTVIAKLAFDKGFATGTGFFVTSSGKLVTNFHVVKRTDYQQILLPGQKKPIDAHILAADEEHDLALLQAMIEPPVAVAPLATGSALKMGDPVFALGSPAGPVLEMSLSRGIVSSDKPRKFGDIALIQHDAAINPGNSGGPLLDQEGRIVGVNTLKIKETQGLNFAIPVEQVRDFLARP